jgi:hypothetical protein
VDYVNRQSIGLGLPLRRLTSSLRPLHTPLQNTRHSLLTLLVSGEGSTRFLPYYVCVCTYTLWSDSLGFGRIQRHKNIFKQRRMILLVPRNCHSLVLAIRTNLPTSIRDATGTPDLCLQISMVDHIKPRRLYRSIFLFDSPALLSFSSFPPHSHHGPCPSPASSQVRSCLSVCHTRKGVSAPICLANPPAHPGPRLIRIEESYHADNKPQA